PVLVVVGAARCAPPQPASATAAATPAAQSAPARLDHARRPAAEDDMRTGLIKLAERTCGSAGRRCSRVEVQLALRRVPGPPPSHMTCRAGPRPRSQPRLDAA